MPVLQPQRNAPPLILVVHVDDMLIVGTDRNKDELCAFMAEQFREIKRNRNATHFTHLGMLFEIRRDGKAVKVTQPKHLKELFQMTGVKDSDIATTLCDDRLFKLSSGKDATLLGASEATRYREVLAKTAFITKTRLDILLSVNVLATRSQQPCQGDWYALRRVVRYLNFTKELGLVICTKSLRLHVSADAAFAVHSKDMKGQSGMTIQFG